MKQLEFIHNLLPKTLFNSRKMCFPRKCIINISHKNGGFPHLPTPRGLTFLLGRKKSQTGETPDGADGDTWTFDVTTQPSAVSSCLTFHFPSNYKGYGTPHLIIQGVRGYVRRVRGWVIHYPFKSPLLGHFYVDNHS